MSAPSHADFCNVTEHCQEGGGHRSVAGIGKRDKVQRMSFVVAEAMRMLDRLHISKSESIGLHVDGRAPRLTVRFSAGVMDGFRLRKGLLRHVNYIKSKSRCADAATNLATLIQRLIRNFCTFAKETKFESFDNVLFEHIRKHTELVDADAEGVAQLANQELTNAFKDVALPFFPNAKVAIKDTAHEARRCLSRPIEANAVLSGMLSTVVTGPQNKHVIFINTYSASSLYYNILPLYNYAMKKPETSCRSPQHYPAD